MRAAVILLALAISGCATTATPKLPLPDRPVLPSIPQAEMMCLSDDAWRKLVEGRKLLLNHIDTLENIIITTH